MCDEVDEILGDRFTESNFMTNLYADDKFLLHRIEYEEQLVQDAKDQVERMHLLEEMDETLVNLAQWKEDRK